MRRCSSQVRTVAFGLAPSLAPLARSLTLAFSPVAQVCARWLIGCGILSALVGVVTFFLLEYLLVRGILNEIIIDSPSHASFDRWQTNLPYGDQKPVFYMTFYLFNLTNPTEVLAGASPVLAELGPYVFTRPFRKVGPDGGDPVFSDDGNLVSFALFVQYFFEAELSNGTLDDVIVHFNPAYLGAVLQAGGEIQINIGLSGPVLMRALNNLTNYVVPYSLAAASPGILNSTLAALEAAAPTVDVPALWANGTSCVEPWTLLCLSSVNDNQPSMISGAAAASLLSPLTPLSLCDASPGSVLVWTNALLPFNAPAGFDSASTAAAVQQLLEAFPGLSAAQLQLVLGWLWQVWLVEAVEAQALAQAGVAARAELVWAQWGMGTVLPAGGAAALWPGTFPAVLEYAVWALEVHGVPAAFAARDAQEFLLGPYGIFVSTNVQTLVSAVAALDWQLLAEQWGLSESNAALTAVYLGHLQSSYVKAALHDDIFPRGGTLITQHTMQQLLFNFTDPLLEYLSPDKAVQTLQANFSTLDAFLAATPPDTYFTGKEDVSRIAQYVAWLGSSALTWWAEPLSFPSYRGTVTNGQFAPFMDADDSVTVFDTTFVKTVMLQRIAWVTDLYDIRLARYSPVAATFAVDPLYYQTFEGFANVTSYQSAPVFLCTPNFYGITDPKYPSKLRGVSPGTLDQHATLVDIEQTTGYVMRAFQRLQVNVYLADNSDLDLYYPQVQRDMIVPLFWGEKVSQLTPTQAKLFKSSVYGTRTMRYVLLGVGSALGALLLVVGLVINSDWWYLRRMRRASSERQSLLYGAGGSLQHVR